MRDYVQNWLLSNGGACASWRTERDCLCLPCALHRSACESRGSQATDASFSARMAGINPTWTQRALAIPGGGDNEVPKKGR